MDGWTGTIDSILLLFLFLLFFYFVVGRAIKAFIWLYVLFTLPLSIVVERSNYAYHILYDVGFLGLCHAYAVKSIVM